MNTYGLTVVASLLWAATTWADCTKTTSDYDVVYCGTKLYLQADKELNDIYQKLVGKLNTDGKQRLKGHCSKATGFIQPVHDEVR
jgi:uncharacterized protein YecT (DUF1311 family)